MSTITLKNVPKSLHTALKFQAKTHGRSLNKEILCSLEQMVRGTPMDANQILREAQVCREEMSVYMTQRELQAMKKEGRAYHERGGAFYLFGLRLRICGVG